MSKQRIKLTERELTVNDLKNTDHVGWLHRDGDKGFVIFASGGYLPVPANHDDRDTHELQVCNVAYCGGKLLPTLQDAVKSITIQELYRFDTRKELYQWLAEE